jgi:integrase
MPRKSLTEEGVRNVKFKLDPNKPKLLQTDYFDSKTPGLVLRVNYGGKKVWRALHYEKKTDENGKRLTLPRLHPLGRYPILKLKEARDAAKKFLVDPQAALAGKAAEAEKKAANFKAIAEDWIKRHVQDKALRSEPEIRRCLTKYVYPTWQGTSLLNIRRSHVTALLDSIADEHGARQADMVLAIIRSIMHWYQTRDDDYVSPIVRGMKRSRAAARNRVLSDDEIRALFKACDEMSSAGAFVKMLLYTAQRRDKVAKMRWHELKDGHWHIPAALREKDNAKVLPLPQAALAIIEKQRRVAKNPYVFPGSAKGRRVRRKTNPPEPPHFNAYSQRKRELDGKMRGQLGEIERWTFHDLRRTARTLMSRARVDGNIAELVLGHSIEGIKKVYDQHKYVNEKGEALKQLAHLIDSIINPPVSNVVAITGRRRNKQAASR